jgi:DNA polymerase III subunit alpha
MTFCIVFDTETTGLPKCKRGVPVTMDNLHWWPHIIQLSFIVYDISNMSIVKMGDHIIKLPESVDIPQESTAIHGISREISNKQGVFIQVALKEFMDMYTQCEFAVAHNFDFDINMIRVEVFRMPINSFYPFTRSQYTNYHQFINSLKSSKPTDYCTMKTGKKDCNIVRTNRMGTYIKFPTLVELYKHRFGIEPKNMHNSFNDVIATLRCFLCDMYNKDIMLETTEFSQLLDHIK